jgi:hypothetical protein
MRIAPTDMPLKENNTSNTDIQIRGTEGLLYHMLNVVIQYLAIKFLGILVKKKEL